MKFAIRDIVVTGSGVRHAVFVITEITPSNPKNQYSGMNLKNGRSYRLNDSILADKRVGVADELPANSVIRKMAPGNEENHNFLQGRNRAAAEIMKCINPQDRARWEKLLSMKPGDTFKCRTRKGLDQMTFRYVTDRGYKYVFVAENGNGTRYKYPLGVIVID